MQTPLSRRPLLVAVVLTALFAGCRRGPAGPAGSSATNDATVLPPPLDLRLSSHPGGPPSYVLRWALQVGPVPVAGCIVRASPAAITQADPAAIVAIVSGAAQAAEIELAADTGLRHLRVNGFSASGVEGQLSAELVVDTTSRLTFFAQQDTEGVDDLYAALPADPDVTANLSSLPAPAPVLDFAPSPDGRRMAMRMDRAGTGGSQLYVRALDGSDAAPRDVSGTLVTGGQVLRGFDWSPDGTRLAFAAYKDSLSTAELYIADLIAGGEPQKASGTLVAGGSLDLSEFFRGTSPFARIGWSPDNRHVAYVADQRIDGLTELMIATAGKGGEPTPVAAAPAPGVTPDFAWSPAGNRIAVTGDLLGNGRNELFVAAADSGNGAAVVAVTQRPAGSSTIFDFAWSPDGTRLAYVDFREVFVTQASGERAPVPLVRVSPTTTLVAAMAWSPDGTEIAFTADLRTTGKLELFVAPATGGTAGNLVSGTMPANGDVGFQGIAWSPDGTQLAFVADKLVDNRFNLFVTVPGRVAEPRQVDTGTFDTVRFAWSTSGDRLGFMARDGKGGTNVFVNGRDALAPPVQVPNTFLFLGPTAIGWSRLGGH